MLKDAVPTAWTYFSPARATRYFRSLCYPNPTSWRLSAVVDTAAFHSYSLWLFTASDLKTIVGPSLVFGTANALAITSYNLDLPVDKTNRQVAERIPLVALWIWIHLLPFNINNQTAAGAVEEDRTNKPWRNMPAGRMTIPQAKCLMLLSYSLATTTAIFSGGVKQSIGLAILGTWYNNFAGGDKSCLVRNFVNACGYVCFTSGAMEVAIGTPLPLGAHLVRWLGIVAAIIFSTVHLQDMYDQAGDLIKRRQTVPLVIGDAQARWCIALTMAFWGWICPCYWNGGKLLLITSTLMAISIAARGLLLRTVSSDRLTFKLWNAWMTLVFIMPLASRW